MKLFKGQMLLFWGLFLATVVPMIGLFTLKDSLQLILLFALCGAIATIAFIRYLDGK